MSKVHPLDRLLVIKQLAKKYERPVARPAGWHRRKLRYKLVAHFVDGSSDELGDYDNFQDAKSHVYGMDQGPLEDARVIMTENSTGKQWLLASGRWERLAR